tara:strand:+ start:362 stop:892 length:531 start_codon:yes stop_codon:yes gene_type:complete
MNSPTFTLTFILVSLLLGGMCIGIILFWWEDAKEKINVENVSLLLLALWLPGWLLIASLNYTLLLVDNPRHCWDCEATTDATYLYAKSKKAVTLRELFPVDLDAIEIEVNNAWHYRALYYDIILHDSKYSRPFNQCIFVAVTGKYETVWGNMLLMTYLSQEQVEERIKLCRDALQE